MEAVRSPSKKLSPPAWDALGEALATFQWFKDAFETMVRHLFADAPAVLAAVSFNAPKRRASDELVALLRAREAEVQGLVVDALLELAQYDPDFPHLARLEDGAAKVATARVALDRVKAATHVHSELARARAELRSEFARRATDAASRRSHDDALAKLNAEFMALFASSDPQGRGREFERFLNRLFDLWDLNPRAAYDLSHEQIDGAFTFRTDDYLLEARWWAERLQPKELNDFKTKVDGKARNTLGLCVAVNGFSQGAVEMHSRPQSPLILMDGTDLMPILEGRIGLDEVLERKRRHAAETGEILFRATS